MQIEKIKFANDYKCIKAGTIIDFSGTDNYSALVGLNGSGKTTVLDYLLGNLANNITEIFKTKSINNAEDKTSQSNLPKLAILVYNGESKSGTRLLIGNNIVTLKVDSKLWYIASYILQIMDDPLIEKYGIVQTDVYDVVIEAFKTTKNPNTNNRYFWNYMLELIQIPMENIRLLPKNHILQVVASYILFYTSKDPNSEFRNLYSFKKDLLNDYYKQIAFLSEGQKARLVLQLVLRYLADKDTLILLDEPDANLDIQKKRELFEMIKSCKGQVLLTTHDPIMTKWMKGHLIFMKDGEQIPTNMVDAINEISEGEVSYQETLLMLSECRHYVFVEGKTDIAFIKKAIDLLGYSERFENVTFLSLGSSSAVEDKYHTTISEFLPKDTIKILFLFDADWGGYQGKMQIDKLKKIKETHQKLCTEKYKKEEAYKRMGKEEIKIQIQKIENELVKISKIDFDFLDKLTYYFYNHNDDFVTTQDGDIMEWFYLEDYFSTNTYPEDNKVRKKEIKEYLKDFIPADDTKNDEVLTFHELLSFEQKCTKQQFTKNSNALKNYFKDNLHLINNKEDFEGFRPLLDKILEKLELSNEPES